MGTNGLNTTHKLMVCSSYNLDVLDSQDGGFA